MKQMRYTIKRLQADFPNDDACLEWLKESLYPDGITCPNEKKVTPHHKLKNRKAYSCDVCGHHTYPTAGTIYHKSSTPLTSWFYAAFLMANTRAGISAKQLERELGVTYKTAWRMFNQIRKLMADNGSTLTGEIEMDETYFQPESKWRKHPQAKKYARSSQIVFGMVERSGRARVKHVMRAGKDLIPIIIGSVAVDAQLYTDSYQAYKTLYWKGYNHKTVNHMAGEYVRGAAHTQNVENLWSNMKRGIRGVYRYVSPKYLQSYADEYAFRYSHRNQYQPMFWILMGKVEKLKPSDSSA